MLNIHVVSFILGKFVNICYLWLSITVAICFKYSYFVRFTRLTKLLWIYNWIIKHLCHSVVQGTYHCLNSLYRCFRCIFSKVYFQNAYNIVLNYFHQWLNVLFYIIVKMYILYIDNYALQYFIIFFLNIFRSQCNRWACCWVPSLNKCFAKRYFSEFFSDISVF